MHPLLTDRLTCPRCGPTFGLILRADRLQERRVHEGVLGCPNCRDGFPIREGFADLRPPPRGELPRGMVGPPPPGAAGGGEEAGSAGRSAGLRPGPDAELPLGSAPADGERLVALLGVVRGPGTLALVGEPAALAAPVAASVEDVLVVALDPDLETWPDAPGVSRAVAGPGLPFFSGMLRAVAVDGRLGGDALPEAARVVAPRGRVVVTHAPAGVAAILEAAGLTVLASEAETVVATRG